MDPKHSIIKGQHCSYPLSQSTNFSTFYLQKHKKITGSFFSLRCKSTPANLTMGESSKVRKSWTFEIQIL